MLDLTWKKDTVSTLDVSLCFFSGDSIHVQLLEQVAHPLQTRAEQAVATVPVPVADRLLVVPLLALVVLDVLEIDGEDSWAIEVELLPLALVEDYDVFDFAHAVDALDAQEEGYEGEERHGRRQCEQQKVEQFVHRRIIHAFAVDCRQPDNL